MDVDDPIHLIPETTLNLDFVVRPLSGSDLVDDYLAGAAGALKFYPGNPRDPATIRKRIGDVERRFDRDRLRKAADLISSPTEAARRRMKRVVQEGGVFVTTGQQPGLFGGPLYSVYKGLRAVALADAVEEHFQIPVAPLFWIASEDHDWAEVHHTHVVDLDNDLRRIALPDGPPGEGAPPLHRIVLEPEILHAPVRELAESLPETDFSSKYLELIRDHYEGPTDLSTAFRGLMTDLLGSSGLSFVEAHAGALKEASLPLLLRELEAAPEHEALLRERARVLEDEGYHVQVPVLEGGVNLFLEGPEGRERIFRNGDGYRLRASEARLSMEAIRARAEEDPVALSPNVLLRPVVEATLFPTVAYVAGPGEIGYFAQLEPLFEAHGVEMPVVVPRASLWIVEGKNAKVLEKFGLELEGLARPFHELASSVARDEVPPEVQRALGEFRGAVGEKSGALLEACRAIDPTLKGPISHARNAAFSELDAVEKKVVQAVKRENEIALSQLEKARVHLYPLGKPQERVLNPFYYLTRYGDAFLPAVAERSSVEFTTDPP